MFISSVHHGVHPQYPQYPDPQYEESEEYLFNEISDDVTLDASLLDLDMEDTYLFKLIPPTNRAFSYDCDGNPLPSLPVPTTSSPATSSPMKYCK